MSPCAQRAPHASGAGSVKQVGVALSEASAGHLYSDGSGVSTRVPVGPGVGGCEALGLERTRVGVGSCDGTVAHNSALSSVSGWARTGTAVGT